MKKYQISLVVCLAINLALTGCMRTIANPVPMTQAGDETKSCQLILDEIQQMQTLINTSNSDHTHQVTQNAILGRTGIFLLVP